MLNTPMVYEITRTENGNLSLAKSPYPLKDEQTLADCSCTRNESFRLNAGNNIEADVQFKYVDKDNIIFYVWGDDPVRKIKTSCEIQTQLASSALTEGKISDECCELMNEVDAQIESLVK